MSRRIALKYCGGCDPGFDRVGFFGRIQVVAGERIDWVRVDDGHFDMVLVIAGCERVCPREDAELEAYRKIIVSDDHGDPATLCQQLLGA